MLARRCALALGLGLSFTSWVQAEDALFDRLDTNKDGQIAADEVEGEKKGLFERLVANHDGNKDGKLSREEFTAGTTNKPVDKTPLPGEGGPAGGRPNPAGIMKELDKSGDGKISKDEAGPRIKEMFEKLDANKDGQLDGAELERGLSEMGKPGGDKPDTRRIVELFDRQDANKDGKLELEEVPEEHRPRFKELLAKLGEKSANKEQFARALIGGFLGEGRRAEASGQPSNVPGGLALVRVLDADGNGEISSDELANAGKALTKLDKNGDGKLTKDEIMPAPTASQRDGAQFRPGEMIKERLKLMDKNANGKLERSELPPFLAERFDKLDGNADGSLDEAELRAMSDRIRELVPDALKKKDGDK